MHRMSVVFFVIASVASIIGCSSDTGGRVAVSGTITLKGEPLEAGTIQFVATDGSQMSGASITDGKYSLPADQGLLPGKFTVRVSAVKEATVVADEAPGESARADAENQELVPAEFNSKSTITTEIKADTANTFDLEIP